MKNKVNLPRDLRPLAKAAERAGWTLTKRTGSNHVKWQPPAGRPYYTPSTSASRQLIANATSDLRKLGLKI
jgi:hypothetical protein